ncbi:MAG: diaminobutyrate--2-oxoglutarate transaminase [Candidatus Omnitrophota bacterium]
MTNIFQRRESEVRSYCRSFPVVFERAKDSFLYDAAGRAYLDFFCGAGTMNYGHNPDEMKKALIEYLQNDGVIHSLDMMTAAKKTFLERFESIILQPRGLDFKIQFVAPSGANAIEAALKLSRAVKNRSNVIAFTNSYHGLSAGALSVTSNSFYRREAYIQRSNAVFMPYDGYFGPDIDTIEYLRKYLEDESSGLDRPAAVVIETTQAEGGVRSASDRWLQQLQWLCREFDMLMIVDDVQVGNGRAGTFFSFERAGIQPDMVAMSKAIGGCGLPLSILLLKPELDQWKPGEHTGTFRGNNLAFVAASEALRYWETNDFSQTIAHKSQIMADRLNQIKTKYPQLDIQIRGVGMIYGMEIPNPEISQAAASEAFNQGLIVELCGVKHNVIKFLPPLTIKENYLTLGLDIIDKSLQSVLSKISVAAIGDFL